jgi:hypothetical protein
MRDSKTRITVNPAARAMPEVAGFGAERRTWGKQRLRELR